MKEMILVEFQSSSTQATEIYIHGRVCGFQNNIGFCMPVMQKAVQKNAV